MSKPVTEKQIKAIKNMCEYLGQEPPKLLENYTLAEASALIKDYLNEIREYEDGLWSAYSDYPDGSE